MDHRSTIIVALFTAGCASTPADPVLRPPSEPSPAVVSDPCAACQVRFDCSGIDEAVVRQSSVDDATGIRTCEAFCSDGEQRNGPYRAVVLDTPPRVVLGSFRYGRRDGRWTTHLHDDRGPLVKVVTHMQGPRHGAHNTYYPDGRLHESGAYDRERRHGKWTVHTPDGVVVSEENYVRGTLVGRQITRHANGQIASERNFDESGKPDGRWCSWLAAGTELGCTQFVDGTGVGREYGPDGQLRREVAYEDGERHGTETRIDGERRIEIPWERGAQTGLRTEYVDSCLAEEKAVEAGVANGAYLKRDCTTDEVIVTGRFCDGNFCGLWVHRTPTGAVERVVEYDELSMKLAEAEFADDKLVDFWTLDEGLRLPRAACYQALAGGLCCEIGAQEYRVNADCLPDPSATPETTEL